MTAATTPVLPFPTAAALRGEHERMQAELPSPGAVAGAGERVAEFVRRAVATGTRLDAREDRRSAQAVINYWVSRLSAAGGGHPFGGPDCDTLLADFDPATVGEAAARAEAWVSEQPAETRALARRIVYRLTRLTPDSRFELVPSSRLSLHELGEGARVDAVIQGLADRCVLSVVGGGTREADRVALRSADVLDRQPTFREWADRRRELRRRADVWERSGRPSRLLLSGEGLDDARACTDRTETERRFVDQSRRWEVLRGEWDRRLKWVFGVIALVLLCGLGVIVWFGTWALLANGEKLTATSEKLRAEREGTEDVKARQELSTLRLLVRGQAEVVTARTPAELEIAEERWRALVDSLPADSMFHGSADELLRRARSTHAANQAPRDEPPKTDLQKIHAARDALAKRQVVREALVGVRKVAFDMVLKSASEAYERINASKRYGEAEAFVHEFRTQYWGEMLLVESATVSQAMVQFERALAKIEWFGLRTEEAKDDRPPEKEVKKDDRPPPRDDPARVAEAQRLLNGLSQATVDRLLKQAKARQVPEQLVRDLKQALDRLKEVLHEEQAIELGTVLNLPK